MDSACEQRSGVQRGCCLTAEDLLCHQRDELGRLPRALARGRSRIPRVARLHCGGAVDGEMVGGRALLRITHFEISV